MAAKGFSQQGIADSQHSSASLASNLHNRSRRLHWTGGRFPEGPMGQLFSSPKGSGVARRSHVSLAVLLSVWAIESISIAADVVRAAAPPGERSRVSAVEAPAKSTKRILVVISPLEKRTQDEMANLEAPGGPFETLKKRGWRIGPESSNHIQIVDRTAPLAAELHAVVSELPGSEGPVVVCIEDGAIARSFQRGCTTPLDQWTFGWLMTGNDDRPVDFKPEPVTVTTTGNYRLRGNHWSVDGDWNPSRETVVQHLRASHSNGIQVGWKIETWSIEELRSLHDDIHDREEGFRGRYAATTTASAKSSSPGGAGMKKPGSR